LKAKNISFHSFTASWFRKGQSAKIKEKKPEAISFFLLNRKMTWGNRDAERVEY
jgi:hypothetical protein